MRWIGSNTTGASGKAVLTASTTICRNCKRRKKMTAKNVNPIEKPAGRPFVITRVFDAPRPLVWQAWTERDRLMQWFGPKGFTMPVATLDFRPGGVFHFCLRSPDGHQMWGKFAYREIVIPERIVWVHSFSDE